VNISRQEKTAYLVNIRGRVTGVGFRFWALEKSSLFPSVSGYAKNLETGHVEAFVQGNADEVDAMLDYLRKGPPFSGVESFDKIPSEFKPDCYFFIIE
jgi:acylphosphatase